MTETLSGSAQGSQEPGIQSSPEAQGTAGAQDAKANAILTAIANLLHVTGVKAEASDAAVREAIGDVLIAAGCRRVR